VAFLLHAFTTITGIAGFKTEDNKKSPPLSIMADHGSLPPTMPRRGIQPGEARRKANRLVRAEGSAKNEKI